MKMVFSWFRKTSMSPARTGHAWLHDTFDIGYFSIFVEL